MSLTKQHFESLAERIRWIKTLQGDREDILRSLQREIADFCEDYGKEFERAWFIEACDRPWVESDW